MESTPQIESHLRANMNISKKDIIVGNFLGGLAWGFGSIMGASIIVAIIGAALSTLGVFSAVGSFFQQLPQVPQLK